MKKSILTILVMFVGIMAYAQNFSIKTNGASSTFSITNLTTGEEHPYPRRYITAKTVGNNVYILLNNGASEGRNIKLPGTGAYSVNYTNLRDGNNSDATLASAIAAKDWFMDNTGFNTASGGSGANIQYGEGSSVSITMSVGTTFLPSAPYNNLTESHLLNDAIEDAALQGGWYLDESYIGVIQRRFPVATTSGGNLPADGLTASSWTASFITSSNFSFRVDGDDALLENYRVWVDGVFYNITNSEGINGGRRWATFDLEEGIHYIKVEGNASTRWSGFLTEPNAIVMPFAINGTTYIFGDSFTAGAGSSKFWNTWTHELNLSDNHNILSSGVGGEGYTATGSGVGLKNRIVSDYNLILADNNIPEKVIIAMGVNDFLTSPATVQSDANIAFDSLRTVFSGDVYVLSPFNPAAPVKDSNYNNINTSIKNAISGRSGFYYIDVSEVSYAKFDATHPNDEGHKTLADYVRKFFIKNYLSNVSEAIDNLKN